MGPGTAWAIVGILLGVIFALIGVIYWSLRKEDDRHAKNVHGLRTVVQRIILTLAAKGIMVKTGEDDNREP